MRKALESRKLHRMIYGAIGAFAFLGQATSKDRAAYAGKTKMQQIQVLANNILGRGLGWQPFSGQSNPNFTKTINFNNLWNEYTQMGAMGLVYGIGGKMLNKHLGKYGVRVPMPGKVGKAGSAAIIGGLIGAIIDAPATNNPNPGQAWRPQYQQSMQGQSVQNLAKAFN